MARARTNRILMRNAFQPAILDIVRCHRSAFMRIYRIAGNGKQQRLFPIEDHVGRVGQRITSNQRKAFVFQPATAYARTTQIGKGTNKEIHVSFLPTIMLFVCECSTVLFAVIPGRIAGLTILAFSSQRCTMLRSFALSRILRTISCAVRGGAFLLP